jgi:hypothetical protein
MLSFTGSLKVFVAIDACDMRRGHNGLPALVGEKLKEDQCSTMDSICATDSGGHAMNGNESVVMR